MKVRRRDFLKLGAATAGMVVGATAGPTPVRAADPNRERCKAMLFDATRCIGCRACQTACRDGFGMSPTRDGDELYDQPTGLSTTCPCIIQEISYSPIRDELLQTAVRGESPQHIAHGRYPVGRLSD